MDLVQSQSKSQNVILYFWQTVLKFIWTGRRHRIDNTILKKSKTGGLILHNIRYKVAYILG